jgi:hypothetical protein
MEGFTAAHSGTQSQLQNYSRHFCAINHAEFVPSFKIICPLTFILFNAAVDITALFGTRHGDVQLSARTNTLLKTIQSL